MTEGLGDAESDEDTKRRIAIHNEKAKLAATALNNTAVALFAGGAGLPIVGLSFPLTTAPPSKSVTFLIAAGWALAAFGLHWLARLMLNRMR